YKYLLADLEIIDSESCSKQPNEIVNSAQSLEPLKPDGGERERENRNKHGRMLFLKFLNKMDQEQENKDTPKKVRKNRCTQEYLNERTIYRRTGIGAKYQKEQVNINHDESSLLSSLVADSSFSFIFHLLQSNSRTVNSDSDSKGTGLVSETDDGHNTCATNNSYEL
ncbi:Protein of unknown function, partial [Cotesia congregata]